MAPRLCWLGAGNMGKVSDSQQPEQYSPTRAGTASSTAIAAAAAAAGTSTVSTPTQQKGHARKVSAVGGGSSGGGGGARGHTPACTRTQEHNAAEDDRDDDELIRMWKAMGKNLAQKGNLAEPLVVWSRTFAHAYELHRMAPNTVVADSLETAVAHADMVWSSLADDDALMAVLEQACRGVEGGVAGKLFVDTTTVRASTAQRAAALLNRHGAEYVAMPVVGDPGMALSGVLTCLPAGPKDAVDRVKPYLSGVIAMTVLDYGGEEHGKGPLMKLVGGMSMANIIESIAEGHVLADKTGLGSDRLEEFLEAVVPGPHLLHSRRFNTGAYYKSAPTVNISAALRVATLVLELAGATGTSVPTFEVAARLMAEVAREPGVSSDIGGMYGALRRSSGLSWGNQ